MSTARYVGWRVLTAVQSPWRDRRGRLSPLKAATLAVAFVPGIWLSAMLATHRLGPDPFGYLLYQTGLWSLWFLLAALAVTPIRTIFGWAEAIAIRRMLGLTGLAYGIAHTAFYVSNRATFIRIWNEFWRRPTIGVAIVATAGLVVLGLTSFDGAMRRLGIRWWTRLHNLVYPAVGLAVLHFAMSPFSVAGVAFLMVGIFFG